MDLIDWVLELGCNNYNVGLVGACSGRHEVFVRRMLDFGASNLEEGFITSAVSGKFNITRFLADRIIMTPLLINQNLRCASNYGDKLFVEFCIQKCADDWDGALRCSRIGGNMIMSRGGNPNCGLRGACFSGNIKVAKLMIEKGVMNV